jgi:hypothetical protein
MREIPAAAVVRHTMALCAPHSVSTFASQYCAPAELSNFGTSCKFISHLGCSSTMPSGQLTATCLRDLARHFKTDPTERVVLCFAYQTR